MKKVILLLLLKCLFISFIHSTQELSGAPNFIEIESTSPSSNNLIEGNFNYNGNAYTALCDCQAVPNRKTDKTTTPSCDPSKLRIISELEGVGASYDEVRKLIGNIEDIKYVPVEEMSFKCLDGRYSKPVLGTPGGDSGEFIMALMVYQDMLVDKHLTQEGIDNFFSNYLNFMKHEKFYMCTDDNAINHLETELSIEGLNIRNPRKNIQADLMDAIVKPANIGDLHIRMMIKYSEQYGMRKDLIEMFIKSFFKILWNKEDDLSLKLELEILNGDHFEKAFIEVNSENECQKAKLAPLFSTRNKNLSVFINHLDASYIRRESLAHFFSGRGNHKEDPANKLIMQNRLIHHGLIALEITGAYVAKGIPFYTIKLA